MLIEKDDVVRKMVAGMLTADGYRVIAAETPKSHENSRSKPNGQSSCSSLTWKTAERHWHANFTQKYQICACLTLESGVPSPVDWIDGIRQSGLAKPFA